jgi:hypothetical protein
MNHKRRAGTSPALLVSEKPVNKRKAVFLVRKTAFSLLSDVGFRLERGATRQSPDNRNRHNGTQEGDHNAADVDAVNGVGHTEQLTRQEATDKGAYDPHNNISHRVATATSHHLIGKPTGNETHNQPG